MRRTLFVFLSVLFVIGCAGSTSFLGGNPSIDLAQGASDSVTLEFEAEGSQTGDYDFTATPSDEGLTAEVVPVSASVDGVIELTVMITASDDAEIGHQSVYVEGKDGDNSAGISISVEVFGGGNTNNSTNNGS